MSILTVSFFLASAPAGPASDVLITFFAALASIVIGVLLAAMILVTKNKLVTVEECYIQINDDPSMTKTVFSGGTLLETLTSQGIPVPSPCGGKATCKQCRIQVTEGAGDALETDKSTFSKKEVQDGWRLSCQCKVKNSIHVEIPEELMDVKSWEATVVSNENVATFIKELVVEVPEDVPYKSGGYLQCHVPPFTTMTSDWKETMEEKYFEDWEKFGLFDNTVDFSHLPEDDVIRAYSMASYPAEGRKLMFNIRIATPPFVKGVMDDKIPWGICSSYTFGLKPGDKLKLSGPYGESYMINDDRELVFLIGGAGSSFGRSHILHLLNTENSKRKITMWYGARSAKENIYQEEYESLAKEHENFTYNLVLSEPLEEDIKAGWPKDDPVKTGYLFKSFEIGQLKKMDEPEECLFYVCGPPMHNLSVMRLLEDYGVPRDNIMLDDFGS
ncbi:MAG: Na+-transporting NADH:ubiquinone oxidoreductase subunit F [Chlamydiales bacterium]|jgi:Na+-transporting NADH:ubiquinone oxidoreductase subunit F